MSPISFQNNLEIQGCQLYHHLGSLSSSILDNSIGESGRLLLRQSSLSIPIPPGIILTREVAKQYSSNKEFLEFFVKKELKSALSKIDQELKNKLYQKRPGPLFSLRSLNSTKDSLSRVYSFEFIGLSEKNVAEFEPYCPDGKAIYLNFLKVIKDYASFIFHTQKRSFLSAWEQIKKNEGATLDSDVTTDGLQEACLFFLHIFKKETGRVFPQDIEEQIELLLRAIYERWEEESEDPINAIIGTARPLEPELLIQGMVFSNLSAYSGQGSFYSRNPASGDLEIYGDYFQKRGSEDIFNDRASFKALYANDIRSLQYLMPSVFNELLFFAKKIESDLQSTVRIDFTIEDGVLFITNLGKAEEQPLSLLKSVSHLMKEGIIDCQDALLRITPHDVLDAFLQSETFKFDNGYKDFTAADAPSTGLCVGRLAFTESMAEEYRGQGFGVILFKECDTDLSCLDTKIPSFLIEDGAGIIALKGTKSSLFFQTLRARNIPSLLLGDDVVYDPESKRLLFPTEILKEGDLIALDANAKKITPLDSLFPEIARKKGSLAFFDQIRQSATQIKDLSIIPLLNEQDSHGPCLSSLCINLDCMLSSFKGSQWTFFLGNDEEKNDSFKLLRSFLKVHLSPFFSSMPKTGEIHFLFPKETSQENSLQHYLDRTRDKSKCALKAAGIVETLKKNHITFEEVCPHLLEAITLSIADSLVNVTPKKTIFFLQNIHHISHFSTIKKRIAEKLIAEGYISILESLKWGVTIAPAFLPEDFSQLASEADYLLFDLRCHKLNQEDAPPHEILRLAIKEAKREHPSIEIGLITDDPSSIAHASFAERNHVSIMITKQHLIDACAISAAKEHIFPRIN